MCKHLVCWSIEIMENLSIVYTAPGSIFDHRTGTVSAVYTSCQPGRTSASVFGGKLAKWFSNSLKSDKTSNPIKLWFAHHSAVISLAYCGPQNPGLNSVKQLSIGKYFSVIYPTSNNKALQSHCLGLSSCKSILIYPIKGQKLESFRSWDLMVWVSAWVVLKCSATWFILAVCGCWVKYKLAGPSSK